MTLNLRRLSTSTISRWLARIVAAKSASGLLACANSLRVAQGCGPVPLSYPKIENIGIH